MRKIKKFAKKAFISYMNMVARTYNYKTDFFVYRGSSIA